MKPSWYGLAIVAACLLTIMSMRTYVFITAPTAPAKPLMIEIRPGTSAFEIARELKDKGVITNATMFMTVAVLTGKVRRLQAGTYVFEGRHYPLDIMMILFRGKTMRYRVTIPEGSTIYDIGAIIAETGLMTKADFINSASSPATTAFFGLKTPSMEGFLYPDTYFLAPHMTPLEIMSKMVNRFHESFPRTYVERSENLGLSLAEVVTLASIIQKEAVSPAEKPIISSVFHNRLKKNMPLQSDPTAVYGIDGFRRKILPEDLRRDTPYNTYRCEGLPPGPICNPDIQSIMASLWPARTDYLFFVSKGDGTHHFSRTFQEHNETIHAQARIK